MIRTITAIASLLAVSITFSAGTASAQWTGSSHWRDLAQQSRDWRGHINPRSPLDRPLSRDLNGHLNRPPAVRASVRPGLGHPRGLGHGSIQGFGPDLGLLDSCADQLQLVAVHLHDDAHALSRGYRHWAAIKHYVSNIERLQTHMHDVLHQAASNQLSHGVCLARVRSDVRLVSIWAKRLDRKLSHQGLDGACPADLQLIQHMRFVIATEMNPLLALLDQELSRRPHQPRSHHGRSALGESSLYHSQHSLRSAISRRPSMSLRWGF